MKYNRILIDISNFFHRAFHIGAGIKKEGIDVISESVAIALRMLQRIEREYLGTDGRIYFLFDNCASGVRRRKEIDPEYKKDRSQKDDAFYKSMDFFQMILLNFGDSYSMVRKEGYEADDLIEALLETFPEDDSVLLISNDMDWFRSISDTIHVAKYESHDYVIYNVRQFVEKFGFEPTIERICTYKCIRGDKSDNIPIGVVGIRNTDLIKLITEYNSIQNIYNNLENISFLSMKMVDQFVQRKSRIMLNYQLVSFQEVDGDILESVFDSKYNPQSLLQLYHSLGLEIEKVDPRIVQYRIKKENKNPKDFFKKKKIPRA